MKRTATALALLVALVAAAADDDLVEIEALAAHGRTETALSRLEDLLVAQPERFDGQLLRGVLLAEVRRTGEAERHFRNLERQFPARPEPSHNLAVLAAARGHRATAIVALEEIVAHYPGYETAAVNLQRIRSSGPAGSFDPLDPSSSRSALILTARPGSFERIELEPEPEIAAPASAEALPPAEPAPAVVHAPPAPAPASEPPAGVDLRDEVAATVAAWAEAWSRQRVREYLDFYAADFQPVDHPSRRAWEEVRRQRVAAPTFIEVEVELETMTLRQSGSDEASVTFTQSYRSDRYQDTVEKTLDLVLEDGAWRIRRETSR